MTVRTLSGATVTLVGRGANYFDGDKIIPSFVDANGTQYFIIKDPDDWTAVPAIVDGLLTVGAAAVPPRQVQLTAANTILVNDPTTVENSTSALVFAKRCGIDVSLEGLTIYYEDNYIYLSNQPLTCIDGVVQLTSQSDGTRALFVREGWVDGSEGYVDCSYQPLSDYEGDYVQGVYLDLLWDQNISGRRHSHNAWIFVLAGVPESVFAVE